MKREEDSVDWQIAEERDGDDGFDREGSFKTELLEGTGSAAIGPLDKKIRSVTQSPAHLSSQCRNIPN